MKGKGRGRQKSVDGLIFIIIGLTSILVVSLLDGPVFSFVNAIQHVISDLTVDVKVHAYIAGLILLIYGIYRRYKSK